MPLYTRGNAAQERLKRLLSAHAPPPWKTRRIAPFFKGGEAEGRHARRSFTSPLVIVPQYPRRVVASPLSSRGGSMSTVCAIPGAALAVDRSKVPDAALDIVPGDDAGESTAVLAGGCFWCTEAVFQKLDGVLGVTSGYSGGGAGTANYNAVCSGATDHAE